MFRHVEYNDILHVWPKYDNLKQEILEYKYMTKKLYEGEVLPKANAFAQSESVRIMERNYTIGYEHWSPEENYSETVIEKLICMILYTDYTDLSSQFTATFRRRNPFEPLEQTKRRHRNYYWMSTGLRKAVEFYGISKDADPPYDIEERIVLRGPFYCGMNAVMNIPSFYIRLLSPTSTSVHIETAMKFSGENGMIIQFGNDNGLHATLLKGLDVSFISRYKEEDERY